MFVHLPLGLHINHVPDVTGHFGQTIVQFLQGRRGAGPVADLAELDTHLPGGRVELVEFLGGRDDDALNLVGGHDQLGTVGCASRVSTLEAVHRLHAARSRTGFVRPVVTIASDQVLLYNRGIYRRWSLLRRPSKESK